MAVVAGGNGQVAGIVHEGNVLTGVRVVFGVVFARVRVCGVFRPCAKTLVRGSSQWRGCHQFPRDYIYTIKGTYDVTYHLLVQRRIPFDDHPLKLERHR